MADILPFLETMENRWMRAWAGRDSKTLKALTSRKFRLVVGSKPCVILDSKSWLEAAGGSFRCRSYRFGDIYARKHGSMAIFAAMMDLDATLDGHDWSGRYWITDVWERSTVKRNWRVLERVMSRPEADEQVPGAIRSLQLWR